MGPIDYQIQVASPFEAAMQGYQGGAAIRNDQQQQAQMQAQAQQQAALRQAYATASADPSAANLSRLMLMDPKSSEGIKRAWEVLDTDQQRARVSDLTQWAAAIQNGAPEIAADAMLRRAEMMEAQGGKTPESAGLRAQAQIVQQQPQHGLALFQAALASNPNGKQAADTLASLGGESRAAALAAPALTKATADADAAVSDAKTKAIAAQYGEKSVLLELQKKGVEIQHLLDDTTIKKEANRISAMNAAISREGNALKQEELKLKISEARTAIDDKLRAKASEFESAKTSLQDAYTLVRELRDDPDLRTATGGLSVRGSIPGTRARAIAGKIERMQSMLTAENLDKLKGAMSDKDIKFLTSIGSNLDRGQNEDDFEKELGRIENVLVRGDRQLRAKFGGKPITGNRGTPIEGRGPATVNPRAAEVPTAGSSGNQRNIVVDY